MLKKITKKRAGQWHLYYTNFAGIDYIWGKNRSLTPYQILELDIPLENKLEILLRPEIIPDRWLRYLACHCADWAIKNTEATGLTVNANSKKALNKTFTYVLCKYKVDGSARQTADAMAARALLTASPDTRKAAEVARAATFSSARIAAWGAVHKSIDAMWSLFDHQVEMRLSVSKRQAFQNKLTNAINAMVRELLYWVDKTAKHGNVVRTRIRAHKIKAGEQP